MSFAHPWILLLIPLVGWWLRRQRARTSLTVPSVRLWPSEAFGRARFLWLPPALRLMAILLLLVALARPQAPTSLDHEANEGIAIQLLVDISSSMDADIHDSVAGSRSRMEVAKEMVERFIIGDGDRLAGRPNDLIGLITFARYADTRSPLTHGHKALVQIVRNLTIQQRPNEDGTAYGDALALAAARLNRLEELSPRQGQRQTAADVKSRVIVLLTDGENNSGAHLPTEAAGLAKKWDCRIYAISLGEAVPVTGDPNSGRPLSAAERVLEHISKETGGLFRRTFDLESLTAVYSEIDRLERSRIATRSIDHTAEWFWLPLVLSLSALFLALCLEATWLRIIP